MTDSPLLLDAMGYLDRGWCAIPDRISTRGEKKPLIKWGPFKERLPTAAELRTWFNPKGRYNANAVALVTGKVSGGLTIRDFDERSDPHGYEHWCEQQPKLCRELPTSRTHGGYHVWSLSEVGKTIKLTGGEYRAGPTLSIVPHSTRPTQAGEFRYHWVIPLPKGKLPVMPP